MREMVQKAMEIETTIYERRSVREFTAEEVDEATIRKLIDAAIQAPSAVNQQPWSFCVIRDKAILARISQEAKDYLMKSSPAGLLSHHLQQIVSDPSFDIFYDAPVLILISSVLQSPWAVENCSLAAENLMLSAYAAGLGSCWIGFAQAWLGTPDGKALLDLPSAYAPIAPIIIGHPKSQAPAIPRRAPEIRWIG